MEKYTRKKGVAAFFSTRESPRSNLLGTIVGDSDLGRWGLGRWNCIHYDVGRHCFGGVSGMMVGLHLAPILPCSFLRFYVIVISPR